MPRQPKGFSLADIAERPEVLSNPRADSLRAVKSLSGRSFRRRKALSVVEGPQSVRELLKYRVQLLKKLYVTKEFLRRGDELLDYSLPASVRVFQVSDETMGDISTAAQGVLAVTASVTVDLNSTLEKDPSCLVFLDEIQDPGNLGTIIRLVDAFSGGAVLVGKKSADPNSPKVIRASAGSIFHLPVVADVEIAELIPGWEAAGRKIYLATADGQIDLESLPGDSEEKSLWIFGNEARGPAASLRELVATRVSIAMPGAAESLNVATAAAICLYRQCRRTGTGEKHG